VGRRPPPKHACAHIILKEFNEEVILKGKNIPKNITSNSKTTDSRAKAEDADVKARTAREASSCTDSVRPEHHAREGCDVQCGRHHSLRRRRCLRRLH
jgi:hypothetical protein